MAIKKLPLILLLSMLLIGCVGDKPNSGTSAEGGHTAPSDENVGVKEKPEVNNTTPLEDSVAGKQNQEKKNPSLSDGSVGGSPDGKKPQFRVIYFPQTHAWGDYVADKAKISQNAIYTSLKALIRETPDLKIVSEGLYYEPGDQSSQWHLCEERYRQPVSSDRDALAALLAENHLTIANLVKSVSLAEDGPFAIAHRALRDYRKDLCTYSPYRTSMPYPKKLISFDREVEIIEVIAKLKKQEPTATCALIFGRNHRFSRYFEGVSQIRFEIAPGFTEGDPSGEFDPRFDSTDKELEDWHRFYVNPLK